MNKIVISKIEPPIVGKRGAVSMTGSCKVECGGVSLIVRFDQRHGERWTDAHDALLYEVACLLGTELYPR